MARKEEDSARPKRSILLLFMNQRAPMHLISVDHTVHFTSIISCNLATMTSLSQLGGPRLFLSGNYASAWKNFGSCQGSCLPWLPNDCWKHNRGGILPRESSSNKSRTGVNHGYQWFLHELQLRCNGRNRSRRGRRCTGVLLKSQRGRQRRRSNLAGHRNYRCLSSFVRPLIGLRPGIKQC